MELTRKQVIEELKAILEMQYWNVPLSKAALEMAIKALEQEPTPNASYCKLEDCISRKAVLKLMKDNWHTHNGDWAMQESMDDIRVLPSVTPQERKGHWVKTPKAVMGEGYMWYCDKCEHQVYQDSSKPYPSEKYCPNCGCCMIEPQESEEV